MDQSSNQGNGWTNIDGVKSLIYIYLLHIWSTLCTRLCVSRPLTQAARSQPYRRHGYDTVEIFLVCLKKSINKMSTFSAKKFQQKPVTQRWRTLLSSLGTFPVQQWIEARSRPLLSMSKANLDRLGDMELYTHDGWRTLNVTVAKYRRYMTGTLLANPC